MLSNLPVSHILHAVFFRPVEEKTGNPRDELPERCGFKVEKYAEKSLAHEVKQPAGHLRVLLQESLKIGTPDDANPGGDVVWAEQ
jgi:hypothetical protein